MVPLILIERQQIAGLALDDPALLALGQKYGIVEQTDKKVTEQQR